MTKKGRVAYDRATAMEIGHDADEEEPETPTTPNPLQGFYGGRAEAAGRLGGG